jgi:hypothetical protein
MESVMANGRLWLVCNKCGDRQLLFKYWGHESVLRYPRESEDFVDNHMLDCYDLPFGMEPNEDGELFRLEGEN